MKKKLEKIGATSLFHFFSFLGIFIKNQKITKKKLVYGALIIGLTASVSSCHRHAPACYSQPQAPTCYSSLQIDSGINDSTKTNSVKTND